MTTALELVPDADQFAAVSTFQQLLPDLVGLTLNAKQAHWNLYGPAFLPLHALTDEIGADARTWADRVAERAVALGYAVDARPGTAAAGDVQLPGGWLSDAKVISELIKRIDAIAATARHVLATLERGDAVGHDLTVQILEGLEKYSWMLRGTSR